MMTRSRVLKNMGALLAALAILAGATAAPVLAATTTSSTGSGAGNGMKVSPVHTELTMKPGESTTVDISFTNVTGVTTTFQAILNDFVASGDESGNPAIILNPAQAAPSHGLKQYIAALPDFTLSPGATKDIKAVINMPNNVAPGGYYGAVRFAAVAAGGGKNVSLSASVASLILVRVSGDVKEQVTIAGFDARDHDKSRSIFTSNKNIEGVVRFQNEGNVQEQPFGKMIVKNMHGKTIGTYSVNDTQPAGNVLPDSIRKFSVPLKNISKFGKYTIEGNFGYGSAGQLLTAKTTFYVIPIPVIVTALVLAVLIIIAIFEAPRLVRRYNRRVLRKAGRQ